MKYRQVTTIGKASKMLIIVKALALYSLLVHSESQTYETLFLIYERPLSPNMANRNQ